MATRKDYIVKRLGIITAVVLCSIVVLQGYWLVTSYRQQKIRFQGDIQNALSVTNIKLMLEKTFNLNSKELLPGLDLHALSKKVEELDSKKLDNNGHIEIQVNAKDIAITDTAALLHTFKRMLDKEQLAAISSDMSASLKAEMKMVSIDTFKIRYQKELLARGIEVPFELAIVNENGGIQQSTCDTNGFKAIPVKSVINDLNEGPTAMGIQAAFPNANLYLLSKMMWVLIVTLVLIVIGVYSFAYLMITFFRQKKIAEIRNDFMNNMAHELKTPISSVNVALDMMLDKQRELSEEKKTGYLQAAQQEMLRLNNLVEIALDIISLESDRVELKEELILLAPLIKDVAAQLAPLTDKKSAIINIADNVKGICINADRIHMFNVLQNIIENALKYNDKSTPVINIDAGNDADGVVIKISDNGPGIPSMYIGRIFEKFFRVPIGDLHAVKGYGLGLSYVKTIVEMHGGTVSVQSVPRQGSTFIIHLPKQ